jgi:DNA-binding protein
MQVKVNTSQNQSPKTNLQTQEPKIKQEPNINLSDQQLMEQILQLLQQSQKMRNNSSNNSNNEFIVKSKMKASYVAIRVEQMLQLNKTVTLSGLGYAIVPLVDSIMLVRKDLQKIGKNVNIQIELFEQTVGTKTISGVRATLSLS